MVIEEGNHDNSDLETLLLDLANYRAAIEGVGAAPIRAERDALLTVKGDLTDTSSLYPETLALYTQNTKIAHLFNLGLL